MSKNVIYTITKHKLWNLSTDTHNKIPVCFWHQINSMHLYIKQISQQTTIHIFISMFQTIGGIVYIFTVRSWTWAAGITNIVQIVLFGTTQQFVLAPSERIQGCSWPRKMISPSRRSTTGIKGFSITPKVIQLSYESSSCYTTFYMLIVCQFTCENIKKN